MRKSTVGWLLFGVSAIGGFVLNTISNQYAKKNAADCAENENIDDTYTLAQQMIATRDNLMKSESRRISDHMRDWDLQHDRKGEIEQINRVASAAMTELEKNPALVENSKVLDIEIKRKAALAASKKALGYDKAKKAMETTIKEAKEKFEKQSNLLSISADETLESTATAMRHEAEKVKNQTIDAARKRFAEVEEKYKAKEEEWDAKLLDAKTVREEMLAEGRRKILANKEAAMDKLNKARETERKFIRKQIEDSREAFEQEAVDNYPQNLHYIENWESKVRKEAMDLYSKMGRSDKIAKYLKSKNVTAEGFLCLGSLPLLGFGLVIWEYVAFLCRIAKKLVAK